MASVATEVSSKIDTELHINFSISGGCFLYQMGCAYFIQRHFNTKRLKVKFSGSSGGGPSALLLAADVDISEALRILLEEVACSCRDRPSFGVLCIYDQIIRTAFRRLFDGINLKDILQEESLAISVTRLSPLLPFFTEEVITTWESNEDVIDAGIASALVPFAVNGRPFAWYRGGLAFDGAITNVIGSRKYEPKAPSRMKSSSSESGKKSENLVESLSNLVWGTYSTVTSVKTSLFSMISSKSSQVTASTVSSSPCASGGTEVSKEARSTSMSPTADLCIKLGALPHSSEKPYGLFRLASLATHAVVYPALEDTQRILDQAKNLPKAMLRRFQSTAIKILRRYLPQGHPLLRPDTLEKKLERPLPSSPTKPRIYDHRERIGDAPQYPATISHRSSASSPATAWSKFTSWLESAPEDDSISTFDKWLNESLQATESSSLIDSAFLLLGYKLVPVTTEKKSSTPHEANDAKISAGNGY